MPSYLLCCCWIGKSGGSVHTPELYRMMQTLLTINLAKYNNIAEKYGAPRITNVASFLRAQIQRTRVNPFAEKNGAFDAITIHVPTVYRAVHRVLLSDIAADNLLQDYCNTTLAKFPSHSHIPRMQIKKYKEFVTNHRIVNIFHLEKEDMKRLLDTLT